MKKRNVLLSHLNPDLNSAICRFLEKYSGLKFDTEYLKVPRFDKMCKIGFMFLYMFYAARLFLKRKQLGVIVSWSDYVCGMYYACLCRFFHVRKTSQLILMAFIYNNHNHRTLLGRLKCGLVRYAACSEFVDYVVVFSRGEVDYYHNLLGIPKHKIHFSPLSKNMTSQNIDIKHITTKKSSQYTLPIKIDRYIFSVGVSNRDYGFLIKTLDGTKYKVHIACSSMDEKNGTSNIKIHSNLFGTEMLHYMQTSYCVVIPLKGPKIISSGQLVLLQALYMKKPIICTRGSCIADYLIDGYNAILVENNEEDWLNALERLYTDKELYHRLAENGYKTYMRAHRTECCARNITTLIEKSRYHDS